MASAFCPGHITCFFQPDGRSDEDYASRGSRGVGIKTSLGSRVTADERPGGETRVTIDGKETFAPVSLAVIDRLAPGKAFDVYVENDVPVSQGFGMSASGALALALCLNSDYGEALYAAHAAEIEGGGGLGDIAGISGPAGVNVRVSPGIGDGCVEGTDIAFGRLTLAILGEKVNTGILLADYEVYDRLVAAGRGSVDNFMAAPTKENLFLISNIFSSLSGVRSPGVSDAIGKLRVANIPAGMCMLGNSIFVEATEDEVREALGEDVRTFTCRSTPEPARLVRRA